jgi:hypothetical protein
VYQVVALPDIPVIAKYIHVKIYMIIYNKGWYLAMVNMQQGGYMVGFHPTMKSLMIKHGNLACDTQQQFDVSLLAIKYLQSTQQLYNDKSLLQYHSHLSLLRTKFYSKVIDRQIVLPLCWLSYR